MIIFGGWGGMWRRDGTNLFDKLAEQSEEPSVSFILHVLLIDSHRSLGRHVLVLITITELQLSYYWVCTRGTFAYFSCFIVLSYPTDGGNSYLWTVTCWSLWPIFVTLVNLLSSTLFTIITGSSTKRWTSRSVRKWYITHRWIVPVIPKFGFLM